MLLNYLVYIACLALLLLRCVLLGLTVYYDARAKQLRDATKWAVIAALGGVIACLFYYFLVRRKSKPMLHCSVCGALVSPGESRCSRCNTAGKLRQEVAESSLFLRRSKTMLLSWLIATVMAALICLFFFVAWLSAQGGYIEESFEYVQEPPYEFSIEEATGVLIEEATTMGESVPSGTP